MEVAGSIPAGAIGPESHAREASSTARALPFPSGCWGIHGSVVTISTNSEQALLKAVFNNTSYVVSSVYVQLHTANPGAAGTTSVASNNTRKAVTFAAASGSNPASVVSNADAAWTSVPTAETYTHISLWDASTSGNHLWYGALSASVTVGVGDNFTIASGSLTVTLT